MPRHAGAFVRFRGLNGLDDELDSFGDYSVSAEAVQCHYC